MAFSSFFLGNAQDGFRGRLLRSVLPNFTSFSPSAVTASSPRSSQPLGAEGTWFVKPQLSQRLEGEHLPGVELRGSCRHRRCWRNGMFSWDEARCDGKKGEKEGKYAPNPDFSATWLIIAHLPRFLSYRNPPTVPKAPQR